MAIVKYNSPATDVVEVGVPVGAISIFAGPTEPAGWLMCNGQDVSREDYADLFLAIGELYGAGDGSTTFTLPNLESSVPVGKSSTDTDFQTLGSTGGAKTVAITEAQLPSHTHNQASHAHSGNTDDAGGHNHNTTSSGNHNHSISNVGDHSHGINATINALAVTNTSNRYSGSFSTVNAVNYTFSTRNTNSGGGHGHNTTSTGGHNHDISNAGSHDHEFTTNSATPTIYSTGSDEAHENMPPYIVMNYIIKAVASL